MKFQFCSMFNSRWSRVKKSHWKRFHLSLLSFKWLLWMQKLTVGVNIRDFVSNVSLWSIITLVPNVHFCRVQLKTVKITKTSKKFTRFWTKVMSAWLGPKFYGIKVTYCHFAILLWMTFRYLPIFSWLSPWTLNCFVKHTISLLFSNFSQFTLCSNVKCYDKWWFKGELKRTSKNWRWQIAVVRKNEGNNFWFVVCVHSIFNGDDDSTLSNKNWFSL
jgi:hypothetical protein